MATPKSGGPKDRRLTYPVSESIELILAGFDVKVDQKPSETL
jgi:hypothetical protein